MCFYSNKNSDLVTAGNSEQSNHHQDWLERVLRDCNTLEFLLDSKDLSIRLRSDQDLLASDLKGSSFRLVQKASKRALPFYFMDLKPIIFPKGEKKKI